MPVVAVRLASPGYFATATHPRSSAGRDFTEADGFGRPRVVIVSEKTAERFFPGQDPIGRHITLTMMTKEPAEIVGVVREVKTGLARRERRRIGNRGLRAGGAVRLTTARRWWCGPRASRAA